MRKVFIYMRYKIGDTWKGGGKNPNRKMALELPFPAIWQKTKHGRKPNMPENCLKFSFKIHY